MPVRPYLAALISLLSVESAVANELLRVPIQELDRLGASEFTVIERYRDFVLVSASENLQQRAGTQGVAVAPEIHGYVLQLPYSPARDPQLGQPWTRGAAASPRGLAMVQFHGPIKPEWIAALESANVEVIAYFHPYTYLVWNSGDGLDRVAEELDAVRWVGAWPQQAKLPNTLDTRSASRTEVRVLSYRGSVAERSSLASLDASILDSASSDPVYADMRVLIPGSRLQELAEQSGVISIQPVPTDGGVRSEVSLQQFVGNVGTDNLPMLGYLNWLAPFAVDGNGIRIAYVDQGVDQTHPNLVNRMIACVGSTCSATSSVHGTHGAGIIAADASDNIRNDANFLRGLGVARGTQLFEQVFFPTFAQPGGMLLLMQESSTNGAPISNNSWGPSGSPRGYDADTRQVDVGVRDANAAIAGDQPLTYVLAITNGGGELSTQGTPDEAKNTITVGATRSQVNQQTPLLQWQDLANVSAHGPALDGRKIPHLVAPGCSVDSTIPGGYGMQCGTSMAAPHVSGAAALFAQAMRARTGKLPSPALTRAAMIAATVDLNSHLDADGVPMGHRPDSKQGWGALRLGRLLPQLDQSRYFDQSQVFTATGDSWEFDLRPKDAGKPIDIVLSYTDAPGHGTCASSSCTTPAWNNDINLSVRVGAQTYKGNVFDGNGKSQSGGVADERNNLEAVLFEAGRVHGDFVVRVEAANITSDALPNLSGSLSQDFALVCSNCEIAVVFANGFEDPQ